LASLQNLTGIEEKVVYSFISSSLRGALGACSQTTKQSLKFMWQAKEIAASLISVANQTPRNDEVFLALRC